MLELNGKLNTIKFYASTLYRVPSGKRYKKIHLNAKFAKNYGDCKMNCAI
jgi:hypothetical protein